MMLASPRTLTLRPCTNGVLPTAAAKFVAACQFWVAGELSQMAGTVVKDARPSITPLMTRLTFNRT
jgi:hypothetical protein